MLVDFHGQHNHHTDTPAALSKPDDRREEDHALARNRSAIGYTFMMQAGI